MAIIHGKDVIIYQGASGTTKAIAAAKSCTISKKADYNEKASATQQTAKEFAVGRTEWDVSMDHLVVSDAPFDGLQMVGQTYTLRIVINSTTKTGKAICIQADLGAPVNGLAKGSVKFKGSGPLADPPTT